MDKENYIIKAAKAPFVEMDDTTGMLIGYANVYNVEDLQGDISQVGSFIKTVNEGKSKIKVYKNHDKDKFVGVPKDLDANDPYGLHVGAKMIMDTDIGRDAYYESKFLVENGFESGFSIGGYILKRSKSNKKIVTEYMLDDISVLTKMQANQLSMVEIVKSMQQESELTQEQFWATITKAYDNNKFSESILKSLEEFLSLNEKEPTDVTPKTVEPITIITNIYSQFI